MSMIGNYRKITTEELSDLINNPDKLSEFLYSEENYSKNFNIDKAWQAIHFLLNNDAWKGTPPLSNAVLGGQIISDEDIGYGPARYLNVDEVEKVSFALNKISAEDLLERFDANALRINDIYPNIEWDETDQEYICQNYTELQKYFRSAANEKLAMILFIN